MLCVVKTQYDIPENTILKDGLGLELAKYSWHGNIHCFIVDGDEFNIGLNGFINLSSNHLWTCGICT